MCFFFGYLIGDGCVNECELDELRLNCEKNNKKIEKNWEIFRHLDDLLQPWDATARSINDATIQKPFGFNNKSWLLWTMVNYLNWTCVNQIIVTVLEYGSSSIFIWSVAFSWPMFALIILLRGKLGFAQYHIITSSLQIISSIFLVHSIR